MAKESWGVKRTCRNCATRFYDLHRDPMTCPACGHQMTRAELDNPAGSSAASAVASRKAPAAGKAAASETAKSEPESEDVTLAGSEGESTEVGEDVLEEEDDSVPIEDIADVASNDDEG